MGQKYWPIVLRGDDIRSMNDKSPVDQSGFSPLSNVRHKYCYL